jgi:DNA-binding response OmpR family regulator
VRVLLVEDEPRIAAFLTKGLSRHGFTVDWAATGSDALARARGEDPPDVVILDLGLPDIDGLDVLRTMRHTGVSAPVVVLTARAGLQDRATALELGARDYLTKPVPMADLVARILAQPSPPAA